MSDFLASALEFWNGLPAFLRMLGILLGGLPLSLLARSLVAQVFRVVSLDKVGERSGLAEFLKKGGVGLPPSRLMGEAAYWVCLLGTGAGALKALDPLLHASIAAAAAKALPGLVAGALVFALGALLTTFVGKFAYTIARNAAMAYAVHLSRGVKVVGYAITLSLSLEQVGLGRGVMEDLLLVAFGAAAFGTALAFGLGCKDMAREAFRSFASELRERARAGQGRDLEG